MSDSAPPSPRRRRRSLIARESLDSNLLWVEGQYVATFDVTSAPGLRFAKLHQDVYSCHDVVLLEFSIVGPNSCLQFSASAELTTLSRQHVLCPIVLQEIPGSASLQFDLPKKELSKAQRLCKGARKHAQSLLPNASTNNSKDIDETKVTLHKSTEARHAREWVRLDSLKEQETVVITHYREVIRHKIYLLITKKPFSDNYWRKRICLDWDESLFRAVFRPLGKPTRPTVMACPKKLATTLDGAWASNYVRMLQFISSPGRRLQEFLSLEDFQKSPSYLLSGYACKHIDIRFVLELAAVFQCNSKKMPGNRMKVYVFVTVSKVTNDGDFIHALFPKLDSGIAEVKFDSAIRQELTLCAQVMNEWHPPETLP